MVVDAMGSCCLRGSFLLWDLCLSLLGTGSFLADMAVDLWVAAGYLCQGQYWWGGMVLALLGLSSAAVQLFSWAWFRVDQQQLEQLAQQEGDREAGRAQQEDDEPGQDSEALRLGDFASYRLLSSPRCLALMHFSQLGFLLRCVHALEVGFQAYRKGAQSQAYSDYAYFLTHDISMLRLFETFIENVPQLTLALYIVLYRNGSTMYQYVSICASFLAISWAVQDYHQSLRYFLKDKHKLSCCSVILYFIWNFFLICPRVLCIALFTLQYQYYIFLHFLIVWIALQIWVWLQKTDFMKMPVLEPFYRGTVALILYFSWFNVAEGKTVFRSIIYHTFITTDSLILLASWWYCRDPLTTDHYALPVFITTILLFTVGLLLRCTYYKWFHPKKSEEPCYDVVDHKGKTSDTFRSLSITTHKPLTLVNPRMCQLSLNVFSASLIGWQKGSQAQRSAKKIFTNNGCSSTTCV